MTDRSHDGLLILVVEDELMIATSLEITLESKGHRVLGPVATVAQARQLLAERRPDLALIDYRLANSTTEALLPDLNEQGVPACVLTGYSRDQLPPAYTGCEVLEKPFRMQALIDAIGKMTI